MKPMYLRVEDDIHKKVKLLAVELETSTNDYVTNLILKDLESRKEQKEKE